jgi:hypothetical protein
MTDTTTETPVSLVRLRHGDTFTFRGKEFVLVRHNQSKSVIASVADGKISVYNLSMSAKVTKTGHDDAAFRLALAEAYPVSLAAYKPGDRVKIVSNDRTRRQNIAGVETTVIRVNSKSITLANNWRVSPQLLESVV